MVSGPNPAISGDAILKALDPDDENVVTEEQRSLDEADLRELERAEYYGGPPAINEAAASASKPRRTILDRLLRRQRVICGRQLLQGLEFVVAKLTSETTRAR